jgi:hypothetical protein
MAISVKKKKEKKKKEIKQNQIRSQILLPVHVNWSPTSPVLRITHVPARHVTLSVTMPRPDSPPPFKKRIIQKRPPRQTPPIT